MMHDSIGDNVEKWGD